MGHGDEPMEKSCLGVVEEMGSWILNSEFSMIIMGSSEGKGCSGGDGYLGFEFKILYDQWGGIFGARMPDVKTGHFWMNFGFGEKKIPYCFFFC